MDIILYFTTKVHSTTLPQKTLAAAFLSAKYIPLKQWAFDGSLTKVPKKFRSTEASQDCPFTAGLGLEDLNSYLYSRTENQYFL